MQLKVSGASPTGKALSSSEADSALRCTSLSASAEGHAVLEASNDCTPLWLSSETSGSSRNKQKGEGPTPVLLDLATL